MYSALTVAKYVIDYTHRTGSHISNLKLQKVLYFLQAQFLVSTGNACFVDRIEAWDCGPVVPSVYHRYSIFGSASIPEARNETMYSIFCHEGILPEHVALINKVLDCLADFSATALVRITQNQAPRKNAYGGRHINSEISWASLKAYFTNNKQGG